MTLPSIVPVGFQATSKDFLKTKVSRGGEAFVNRGVVTIPSGTVSGTIVGLIPVNAGATLVTGATDLALGTALGASVTLSLGIIYDDNVANTNIANLWANAVTGNTAGPVAITETITNLPYVTTGNGWIAITTGGATTGTSGDLYIQALMDYFNGGIQA
jgi:hypothetical protein